MMANEAQLRAWVLAGLNGDEAAHRAFLGAAAGLLRAFFRNRLRGNPEDAEDLVQETLVALHTRRDTYDPTFPLTAWMYAIARYRLIDHLRRTKRRGAHDSIDDHEIGEADPDIDASDAKRDVNALLAKLPPKQRRAIELVKLEEKSVREAADLTGLSESDIKISIHRGMKALMRLMGRETEQSA
ncbi:RNA polymerase sigma-70 factor [alpha proteobacterium U9-1i]|nr:RNA polymerase sigma-70 factor [alpha proteobacterium U9-1i]